MAYRSAVLDVSAMTAEQFLSSSREEMQRRFKTVIETEGPIVDDLLQKRVLRSYGLSKRGRRIQPVLDEVMASLQAVTTTQTSCDKHVHQVFWPEAWRDKQPLLDWREVRVPSERDITEYPIVELANLMDDIGLKTPKKKLFLATLGRLGFKKQGTHIRSSFALAYKWAKERASGKISV